MYNMLRSMRLNIFNSLILFLLLLATQAFAENAITYDKQFSFSKRTVLSFDEPGRLCIETRGYIYNTFMFDFTGETINYNLAWSISENPAAGESDVILSFTGDNSWTKTMSFPYLCVNVTSCGSCTLKATYEGFIVRTR